MKQYKPEWEKNLTAPPVPQGGFTPELMRRIEEQIHSRKLSPKKFKPLLGALTAAAVVLALGITQGGKVWNWAVGQSNVQGQPTQAQSDVEQARTVLTTVLQALKERNVEVLAKYIDDKRFPDKDQYKRQMQQLLQRQPVVDAQILTVEQIDKANMRARILQVEQGSALTEVTLPLQKKKGEWRIMAGQDNLTNVRLDIPTYLKQAGAYAIYNGYYYAADGTVVNQPDIGKPISEIKRTGDVPDKQSSDSNIFIGTVYSIQNVSDQQKIAVKYNDIYIGLQRASSLADILMSSKGDPKTNALALRNVRKEAPFLYEFPGMEKQIQLVSYQPGMGPGVTLYYQLPEANKNDMQGFLFIFEYRKGWENITIENSIPFPVGVRQSRSTFQANSNPGAPVKTFDLNGIHWSYYSNSLLRGEKDDRYYEIQVQGSLAEEKLMDLLKSFKPASK